MTTTDQALEKIETELGDNSLYEDSNKAKLQTLLQQQRDLKQEKDQQEEKWFELTEELESLQSQL